MEIGQSAVSLHLGLEDSSTDQPFVPLRDFPLSGLGTALSSEVERHQSLKQQDFGSLDRIRSSKQPSRCLIPRMFWCYCI